MSKDNDNVLGNLISREVLFGLLKEEYAREPRDENGIKLCDEQIAILQKQILDIFMNGTGEGQPIGILNVKFENFDGTIIEMKGGGNVSKNSKI